MSEAKTATMRPAPPGDLPVAMKARALALVGAAAVAATLLAVLWGRTINHDTAWYLISTRRWLEGARLYVDLWEVNPPLASYLTAPAIWVADALGIGDVNAQYAVVSALTGVSLYWSWSVLIDRVPLGPGRQALAFAGLGVVLILPALSLVAQREHFLMLLVMPWFLAELPGPAGTLGSRIARAAVAALGLCLKPYFLAIPLGVILWQMGRARSLRPLATVETLVMLGLGLAYVAAAVVLHPEYFTETIPTAGHVYASLGSSTGTVLARLAVWTAPVLPFLVLLVLAGRRAPVPGLLVAGMAAGLAAYLVQWKGFDYHTLPFESFVLLAVLWVLLQAERVTPLVGAAALSAAAAVAVFLERGTYDDWIRPHLDAAIGAAPAPGSLFAATTGMEAGPLLALRLGAEWASRYPHDWPVPGAVHGLEATDCRAEPDRCAAFRAILERTREHNIDDIEAWRADMIVIDKRRGFVDLDGFSWYEFFEGSPRWKPLLASYRLTGSTPSFDVWTRSDAEGG